MSRLFRYALPAMFSVLAPFAAQGATVVEFQTPLGSFQVELHDAAAPNTVANFLSYVNSGEYNGSVFHRAAGIDDGHGGLIPFVLQGGGFYPLPDGGTSVPEVPNHGPIKSEWIGTPNSRGTIAMAVPVDSKGVANLDGASNQWYINLNDNQSIISPSQIVVFGHVLGNGMDVVDELANQQTFNFGSVFNTLPLLPSFTADEYFAGDAPVPADWLTVNVHVVPEPASVAMALGGAALIGGAVWRKRRKSVIRAT